MSPPALDASPPTDAHAPLRPDPHGEVRFVTRDEAVRLRGALEAARLLVVSLGDVGTGARGRFGELVDDAIESALRDRGGALPGIGATCEPGASLADQLYRVRQLGRVGLALDVGTLTALVDARGALLPEDGACLRFLAEATRERPLVLLLDAANATTVKTYGAPLPLGEALGIEAPPASAPKERPTPRAPQATPVTRTMPLERRVPEFPRMGLEPATTPTPTPIRMANAPAPTPPIEEPPPPSVELTPAQIAEAASLLEEVTRATPLSGLERAFVDGYAPLRAALLAAPESRDDRLSSAGLGKQAMRALCGQFAVTFARAYAEALPTFGVTGRHPSMIFDVFDLAQKCARVHGARSVQLVIVDALRYDVGQRLRHRMAFAMARRAVCVEESVLWSVLPTTTAVQLDAIVRGEDALRAPIRPERETSIVRGRSLDVLRRMRLGHRDVVKLDLLEGRLRETGAPEGERIDALAAEATPILARYLDHCQPRTLVVIVGDHGFSFGDVDVPHDERAPTPAARQGGASPEEVFVPFSAWLVGGVH